MGSDASDYLHQTFDRMIACRAFATKIARMFAAGDVRQLDNGEYDQYQPDGCSDDDAQALYALIHEARELTGAKPDSLAQPGEAEQCIHCMGWFKAGHEHFSDGFHCDMEDK